MNGRTMPATASERLPGDSPELAARQPFKRHTIVAYFRTWNETTRPVFLTADWDGKRLSMTGVEGPKHDGDALGSCGQITLRGADHFDRIAEYDRITEVWDRWHLNDMRAGCEHQRAAWNPSETVEVVTYGINADAWVLKRAAEKEVNRAAIAGEVANLTEVQRFLIGPEWFRDRHTPPDADSIFSGLYDVKKRENKTAGWAYEREHPRGLLTKPCDVCGYEYGSAWLFEEVPTEVVAFLRGLPDDATKMPPRWAR